MSWLRDYLEFTEHQESPEKFHLWTGITTIAAALGRRVYLERREHGITYYKVYPGQIQTILIGPSGVRKSSALMPARKLLKPLGINMIQGMISTEAFIRQLDPAKGGNPHGLLFESEGTVMLSRRSYAEQLITVLCDLADARDEFEYKTISGGKTIIREPCLTSIFCTTPSSLGDLPPTAHEKGYLSRVLLVYESKSERIFALADVEDEDVSPAQIQHIRELETRLHARLRQIKALAGPFRFTPGGKLWFKQHYDDYRAGMNGATAEGYPNRRPDHLLRVAMVLTVAISDSLFLDEKQLHAADQLLKSIEIDFPKALMHVGAVRSKDRERVVDAIRMHPQSAKGVSANYIYNQVHPYFQDLNGIRQAMVLLQEAGVIKCIQKADLSKQLPELWTLGS